MSRTLLRFSKPVRQALTGSNSANRYWRRSLVLLDDNPAERAQVREALPMVAVPELSDDPAQFARTLLAAGYFETVSLSQEDMIRADFRGLRQADRFAGKARSLISTLNPRDGDRVCGI